MTGFVGGLLNGDAWTSVAAWWRRQGCRLDAREFIDAIDPAGFAAIKARYYQPGENPSKYLDLETWMKTNVKRLRDIPVHRAPPRLRILDIGCGVGYFVFAAQRLGHEAVGLDVKSVALYNEMIPLLGVTRVVHMIKAGQPLPAELRDFDVIAAHMTCFNRRADGSHWGVEEWTYFLADLKARLRPGGTIQLHLNKLDDGRHMADDVRAFFRREGCRIDRGRVLYRAAG